MNRKTLGIAAIVGLTSIGTIVSMHRPVETEETPVSSSLLDSLRTRQLFKENFVPGYNPLNEWYDADFYKNITDSIIEADKNSFYL